MGAYFSKNPDDFQLLAKDPNGQLHMYTMSQIDLLQDCNKLPFKMQPNVKYAFLSSTDKKWAAHVYADAICDIPGNEPVAESTVLNKTANTITHAGNSNSNYFSMSADAVNTPKHGIFYNKEGTQQYAAKSSFVKCIPMPMHSDPSFKGTLNDISYDHNGVAMSFYSDKDCQNEYISSIPADPKKQYTDSRQYNIDNRATHSERFPLPYTDIKVNPYSRPAEKTNAMYYRSYRAGYPN